MECPIGTKPKRWCNEFEIRFEKWKIGLNQKYLNTKKFIIFVQLSWYSIKMTIFRVGTFGKMGWK